MRKLMRYAIAALAVATLSGAALAPASAAQADPQSAGSATRAAVTYTVKVQTGDVQSAGTDSDVRIKLRGTRGSTGFLILDNSTNNFERGQTDTFTFTLSDLGAINSVEIKFDRQGDNPGWYLNKITVSGGGASQVYPYYDWFVWDSTVEIDKA